MFRTRVDQLIVLLIIAALFGGGGVAYGLMNLVVQLAALLILALNHGAVRQFFASAPRALVALVVATLALPLLQLIPLPPSVWSTMPGRELVKDALATLGASGQPWFPMTANHSRTLVAFIGLIAPFAVIVAGWRLEGGALLRAMPIVIGLGLLSVALGVVQVLGSDGAGVLYVENPMPGILFGFFANRNSAGLFLVCCLLLLAAMPPQKSRIFGTLARFLVAVLLALGVVLTQSRTSIVLLALPVALAAFRAISDRIEHSKGNSIAVSRMFLVAGVGAAALASLAPMMGESRLGTVLSRFERTDDERALIWDDANYTAQRYWPVGAGMATFDEVFQADESLEHLSLRKAGRAHNDYLELAIEAGIFGLVIVAGWALWVAFAAWRAISTTQRWPALAGSGILVAIALQSALDYPLRNQTMLCLAGFAILLLAPKGRGKSAGAADETELVT